jgi:putative peptide zinc metalloprotease protein
MFFAPVPYVDVTSSWRFASKWPRIATAAAGMYIELFLGAVAILVWANTASAAAQHVAASVALMASLGTILVNANPLMRFDGYFILADLLEIPNLNMHGRRWLSSLAARLLGCPTAPLGLPTRAVRVVRLYAVAATVWRSIVWVTLMTALVVFLARIHAIPALAGASAIALLAGRGAIVSLRRWFKGRSGCSPKRLCGVAASGLIAIAATVYLFLRPATITAPGVVEYRPLVVVRAASPGFIRELCVRDGEVVAAGQRLVVLENRDLAVELRLAEIEIEKSVARCRALRQAGETAKEQAERSQQAAIQKKRDELAQQLQDLIVVAPAAGQIVGRNLDAWLGRYVETGAELFRIGDEAAKEVLLAVDQEDVELFEARGDTALRVRVAAAGADTLLARDLSIEPRGTTRPPHEALSARLGGPLPVLARDHAAGPASPPADELLDACFKAALPLTADQSRRLRAGQLATIEVRTPEQSWGGRTAAQIERWLAHQIRGD